MVASLELPALHVEGENDLHTVVHLLRRHDIALDKDLGPVVVKPAGSAEKLLAAAPRAVEASTGRSVGFVIDANGAVADRWRAVCDRLNDVNDVGLPPFPVTLPDGGYIEQSTRYKAMVGVWIMPDNKTDFGKLEDLVRTLVPEGDRLFPHAESATQEAKEKLSAAFSEPDRIKATLHCWLAWQKEPGQRFGTALRALYFRDDSEVALRFVAWFRRLCNL